VRSCWNLGEPCVERTRYAADTPVVAHPTTLSDTEFPTVLEGLRRGDRDSAELVFTDMQPRLLRFLRATEPRVADDLAAEVWLAVAQGVGTFEGDLDGFRAWTFTIARRRVADHRRAAVRRPSEPVDGDTFDQQAGGVDPADHVLGGMSAQHAIDLITEVLPADQAEVLLLRVVAGLDTAHVAEAMQRSTNWVRVMQHRGLRRLSVVLSPPSDSFSGSSVMSVRPAAI